MASDDDDRDRRFRAERRRRADRSRQIQIETIEDLTTLLADLSAEVTRVLAAQPSDWQLWRMSQVRQSLTEATARLTVEGTRILATGVDSAWSAGVQLVDAPLAAGGVEISSRLVDVDLGQLMATRSMLTHRMHSVADDVVRKVNRELAGVVAGTVSPSEAIDRVQELVVDGGRRRALTVVRTEVGGAFSAAADARLRQAKRLVPGLQKQWRRSGKLAPRPHHVAADGQIREPDEPFDVGGSKIPHPRHPDIPVWERVNCGCESLPYMASWEMLTPGKRPFTDGERAQSAGAKAVADALELPAGTASVAALRQVPKPDAVAATDRIRSDGTLTRFLADPPAGGRMPVGVLPEYSRAALALRSPLVVLSDQSASKQLRHHPELTTADYDVLGRLHEATLAVRYRQERKTAFFVQSGEQWHKAVVKAVGEPASEETFLVTLYRLTDGLKREMRRELGRGFALVDERPENLREGRRRRVGPPGSRSSRTPHSARAKPPELRQGDLHRVACACPHDSP